MRVLVCGSREWNNLDLILERLSSLPPETILIHGGCRGADVMCGEVGKELGFNVLCFPANWDQHGRSAGPKRNQTMLDEGKPELILAFHNNIESSRGTKDMLARAGKHGLPIEIIKEP